MRLHETQGTPLVGITILNARLLLDEDGVITVTLPDRYPCAFAQLSFRPSVRLKTSRPAAESGSGQK